MWCSLAEALAWHTQKCSIGPLPGVAEPDGLVCLCITRWIRRRATVLVRPPLSSSGRVRRSSRSCRCQEGAAVRAPGGGSPPVFERYSDP